MIRLGTASRSATAVAATSSGGETMAPRASATGSVIAGTMARARPATTNVLASTRPIASETMFPSSLRKLRIGVKNAATYTIGGRTSRRMVSGSTSNRGTPGMDPRRSPPTRSRTGYGMCRRRDAVTSVATTMRRSRRTSAAISPARRLSSSATDRERDADPSRA